MDLANQTLPQESFEAFVFAFLKILRADMRNQKTTYESITPRNKKNTS